MDLAGGEPSQAQEVAFNCATVGVRPRTGILHPWRVSPPQLPASASPTLKLPPSLVLLAASMETTPSGTTLAREAALPMPARRLWWLLLLLLRHGCCWHCALTCTMTCGSCRRDLVVVIAVSGDGGALMRRLGL